MGILNHETREIQARIVYFGAEGAGTTSNLRFIHRKLRREHRGELQVSEVDGETPARYESLPVELGSVRGYQTSIHIYSVPAGDAHRPLRRRILDGVDGIVFVADLRPPRHAATLVALGELKGHLASYGRSLDDVILIAQYNHRDIADENALDALHRRLGLKPAAHFESVASEGTGVLQTLTSLSKLILNRIRTEADRAEGGISSSCLTQTVEPVEGTAGPGDGPALRPAVEVSGEASKQFRIESAGPVEGGDEQLAIPIRLVEEGTGRKVGIVLRLSLDRD